MAKSNLIKQLAKGEIELELALRQLRVLLMDFEKTDLLNWVDNEIEGYPQSMKLDELPDYRVSQGILKGTYIYRMRKYSNVPIPLSPDTPEDIFDSASKVPYYEGISALRLMIGAKNNTELNPIALKLSPQQNIIYQKFSLIAMDGLLESYIEVSQLSIQKVIDSVTNRVFDILRVLEKEFGVLEDLDLNIEECTEEKKNKIIQKIYFIIHDNRKNVIIGDNNKLRNVDIGQ